MAVTKPERELRALLAERDPAVVHLALSLRSVVIDAAPTANEIVYDAGYAISDIFTFTDRWQDSFCYVATYRKHVNLGFSHGASLPDPARRLRGKGKQMRHLQVRTEDDLRDEMLRHFLDAAIAQAQNDGIRSGEGDPSWKS
jgi:hypothetical protein